MWQRTDAERVHLFRHTAAIEKKFTDDFSECGRTAELRAIEELNGERICELSRNNRKG